MKLKLINMECLDILTYLNMFQLFFSELLTFPNLDRQIRTGHEIRMPGPNFTLLPKLLI